MWKGRFQKATSSLVQRYGESISYDWRLYPHDIAGSMAHAEALARAKIITRTELTAIHTGLKSIQADIEAGKFEWKPELEDVHMNIESALTQRIGAPGAKLHTARSRNDQIALDSRLYCRAETQTILNLVRGLQSALGLEIIHAHRVERQRRQLTPDEEFVRERIQHLESVVRTSNRILALLLGDGRVDVKRELGER